MVENPKFYSAFLCEIMIRTDCHEKAGISVPKIEQPEEEEKETEQPPLSMSR